MRDAAVVRFFFLPQPLMKRDWGLRGQKTKQQGERHTEEQRKEKKRGRGFSISLMRFVVVCVFLFVFRVIHMHPPVLLCCLLLNRHDTKAKQQPRSGAREKKKEPQAHARAPAVERRNKDLHQPPSLPLSLRCICGKGEARDKLLVLMRLIPSPECRGARVVGATPFSSSSLSPSSFIIHPITPFTRTAASETPPNSPSTPQSLPAPPPRPPPARPCSPVG